MPRSEIGEPAKAGGAGAAQEILVETPGEPTCFFLTDTYVDGLGRPTWFVDGKAICIVGDRIMWTRGSERQLKAIEGLIYALGPRCGYRLLGFMPECALHVGHTGPHEDGWGGFYGEGGETRP